MRVDLVRAAVGELGGKGGGGGNDQPVIGMGDHVPAFLLREVRSAKKSARRGRKDEAEDGEQSSEAA